MILDLHRTNIAVLCPRIRKTCSKIFLTWRIQPISRSGYEKINTSIFGVSYGMDVKVIIITFIHKYATRISTPINVPTITLLVYSIITFIDIIITDLDGAMIEANCHNITFPSLVKSPYFLSDDTEPSIF